MEDYIKVFDSIIQDSVQKGISVFSNPLTKSFFQSYYSELSQPEACKNLNEYLDEQRAFDAEYQIGISAVLPSNVRFVSMGNDIFLVIKDSVFIEFKKYCSNYGIL